MNFQNGSFVLLWILCCHLHWVSLQVISPQFQYVGLPAVSQTQGEVWPKPQQQITDKSYWVLHPTSFPLTYVGKDCVLVAEAIQRYQTIILRPSRGEQRLNTNRNVQQDNLKLQDENSFGILKSTVVYLDGPCENWPHLDMDEKCKYEFLRPLTNPVKLFVNSWTTPISGSLGPVSVQPRWNHSIHFMQALGTLCYTSIYFWEAVPLFQSCSLALENSLDEFDLVDVFKMSIVIR